LGNGFHCDEFVDAFAASTTQRTSPGEAIIGFVARVIRKRDV
jgi:hypothetical protein